MRLAENFQNRFDIDYADQTLPLTIGVIADGEGITTRLDNDILLDWPNFLNDATTARLHMFAGKNRRVPYEEKLRRMQKLTFSIGAYDSVMYPTIVRRFLPSELMTLLDQKQLPKLEEVVLDTGTPGLRNLFNYLEFPVSETRPHAFMPSWQKLANLAISGELVRVWEDLKLVEHS